MRNRLIFDGIDLSDYDVWLSHAKTCGAPEREVTTVTIPGRSGALTMDQGRYKNIDVEFQCFVKRDFEKNAEAIRNLILSRVGFRRLETTQQPDEFRIGRYTGNFDADVSQKFKQGAFVLKFDCWPQRFLKEGEIPVIFDKTGQIYNRTEFAARPLIRVYGSGLLQIGRHAVQVSGQDVQYIDIDTQMMDAYCGAQNCNERIELKSGRFPEIDPGEVGISLGAGISKIEVIPRWWML